MNCLGHRGFLSGSPGLFKASHSICRSFGLFQRVAFAEVLDYFTEVAFAKDDGRNRLIIVDSSDRTTFDLTLKGENLLQGFVQEIGWISKTKVRNAFAGFVRFDRTSDLPDDFDSQWSKYDAASGHIVVKYR